jgi:hypothetical protein
VLRIFMALRNPSPLTGFERANLGSNGKHTGLQNNFFSVTSTKVVELDSIFYAECKYVLSFSLSRKFFKWYTVII